MKEIERKYHILESEHEKIIKAIRDAGYMYLGSTNEGVFVYYSSKKELNNLISSYKAGIGGLVQSMNKGKIIAKLTRNRLILHIGRIDKIGKESNIDMLRGLEEKIEKIILPPYIPKFYAG